jgi:hypothetical protein
MADAVYHVSCRGFIDEAAQSRINLELKPGAWTGGTLQPGQTFPSVPQRFHFKLAAASEQSAIDLVREIVEGAGGHVEDFEASRAEG